MASKKGPKVDPSALAMQCYETDSIYTLVVTWCTANYVFQFSSVIVYIRSEFMLTTLNMLGDHCVVSFDFKKTVSIHPACEGVRSAGKVNKFVRK